MTNETKIQLKSILYNQISNVLLQFAYEPWNDDTRKRIERTEMAVIDPLVKYNVMFNPSLEEKYDDDTNGISLVLTYKENPDDEKSKIVEFNLSGSSINEL